MREFEFIPDGQKDCSVKAWIHYHNGSARIVQKQYPAIVICLGGAYMNVSDREAEPVAVAFFAAGFNTYILNYSVKEQATELRPLCQLAATILQIRKNAESWYTLPDKIAVCSFSAGGHLAASMGVLWNNAKFIETFKNTENVRPNAMISGYPVITSDETAHVDSIECVSGAKEGSTQYQWFGLDRHVDKNTPPTFLWHTSEDKVVSVENSLRMASALSAAEVPFELHVFPKGPHGMSVCSEDVGTPSEYNVRWIEWSIKWLKELWK